MSSITSARHAQTMAFARSTTTSGRTTNAHLAQPQQPQRPLRPRLRHAIHAIQILAKMAASAILWDQTASSAGVLLFTLARYAQTL